MGDPREQFFHVFTSTPGRSRRAVSWATRQPGWVARAAAFASLIVLTAVVLVLLIPALLIGGVVFVLLSFYVAVRTRFARWSRGREMEAGRENVRVVRRDDPGPR